MNTIIVPQDVREMLDLKYDDEAVIEVDFIRVVKPTPENQKTLTPFFKEDVKKEEAKKDGGKDKS
jgi:hypothetical protein